VRKPKEYRIRPRELGPQSYKRPREVVTSFQHARKPPEEKTFALRSEKTSKRKPKNPERSGRTGPLRPAFLKKESTGSNKPPGRFAEEKSRSLGNLTRGKGWKIKEFAQGRCALLRKPPPTRETQVKEKV